MRTHQTAWASWFLFQQVRVHATYKCTCLLDNSTPKRGLGIETLNRGYVLGLWCFFLCLLLLEQFFSVRLIDGFIRA